MAVNKQQLNTHMTHLEDLIFLQGVKGGQDAIHFLRKYRELLKGNSTSSVDTTVKWDGAPAIFMGPHPESGNFLVAKKSIFAKTTPMWYESIKDIDADPKLSSDLKAKFKVAFNMYKDAGIKKIIQGDFLFAKADLKTKRVGEEEFVSFQPNTIVYMVPAKSELGKKIKKMKMGIVFHTQYTGSALDSMRSDFSITMPKAPDNVWQIDAKYPDMAGTATLTASESRTVDKKLSAAGSAFRSIPAEAFKVITHAPIAIHLCTYVNKFVRAGTTPSSAEAAAGFSAYLKGYFDKERDKRSTIKGKAAVDQREMEIVRPLSAISNEKMKKLFEMYYCMQEVKDLFVKKLSLAGNVKTFLQMANGDLKVTGHEGFVAIDKTGTNSVKLVDRMEFSYANFSDEVIKGWQSDLRR